MLAPIYELLFDGWSNSLVLTEDQVTISYKTYKADDESDMQEIIDQNLAPGEKFIFWKKTLLSVASVTHGHQGAQSISHAMVLDTYDKDQDLVITAVRKSG